MQCSGLIRIGIASRIGWNMTEGEQEWQPVQWIPSEEELMRMSRKVLVATVRAQAAQVLLLWRRQGELELELAKARYGR